jgi:hypothetical protein
MNTKRWLARARITDDPAGDLIADMRRDPDVPSRFDSIEAMRSYLHRKGACRAALAAVPLVWRRYRKARPARTPDDHSRSHRDRHAERRGFAE